MPIVMIHVIGSLVPSPTPSFLLLLSTVLSSDEKLGVGLGTRLCNRHVCVNMHAVGSLNCSHGGPAQLSVACSASDEKLHEHAGAWE